LTSGNIQSTTDLEFEQPYSSKDALCVVGGVITQKDRTLNLNWSTEKTDATVAVNA
jgi:hypothetical protein